MSPWASGDSLTPSTLNRVVPSWVSSVASRVYGVFNPKDYGATGGGVVHDQAGVQAAIRAATTFLASAATEQNRAVVDLGGDTYKLGSAVTFADQEGMEIRNGALVSSSTFSSGGFLLELGNSAGVQQGTRLLTVRDMIFDAGRVSGVGGLYACNHGRVTIENCFFKRCATYGIRSVNGAGLSNDLIVSRNRFDEWPLDDGVPTSSTGTAVSVEHNDSRIEANILGVARAGIVLGQGGALAQYNMVQGNHTYCGYRPGTDTVEDTWGIHVGNNAVHTYIDGNYIDYCRLRLDNPFNVRVTNNLFLKNTSHTTDGFIDINLNAANLDLEGVVIAFNGFQNIGTGNVSMLTFSNNTASPVPVRRTWHTNLIDFNASASSASLLYLADVVGTLESHSLTPVMGFASERSLGLYRSASSTLALSYGTLDLSAAQTSVQTVRFQSSATSTGGGTALLGANSPAGTLSAPVGWIRVGLPDGGIGYIPAWR